jgi:hypothetical protein
MKIQVLILGAIVIVASCNSKPQPQADRTADSLRMAADTSGLAAFQAMKAENELGATNTEEEKEKASSGTQTKKSTSAGSSAGTSSPGGTSAGSSNDGTASTSSGTTKKTGWSKTAKGAVIGGVAGAAGGAIINKKNRGAGAVIGGVVGAGAGAVIGNEMDKKDGRH